MFKLGLPSLNLAAKVVVVILAAFLLVRMTPDSWGIKSWFRV